jgi:hypothetical protein
MWEHEIIEPEDTDFGPDESIEYEKLTIGAGGTSLEIIHVEDGRFFVQAVDCDGEIEIGTADDLETAKKLAERWALAQIAEMLKSLGAEDILMVRDATEVNVHYAPRNLEPGYMLLNPQPPHPRLMLIRFPAGDGGEDGIEYL